jgi:hypothetical protein
MTLVRERLVALAKIHAAKLCQINCHLTMALFLAEVAALYFSPSLCMLSLAASAGGGILGSLPVQIPFLTSTTAVVSSAVFLVVPWVATITNAVKGRLNQTEA